MDSKIITDNYGERITEVQSSNTFALVRQPKSNEATPTSIVILNVREAEEVEKDLRRGLKKLSLCSCGDK